MQTFEHGEAIQHDNRTSPAWFTQPGPTESFRRTAPEHLLRDKRESPPVIEPDPSWFTAVGPTPGFLQSR